MTFFAKTGRLITPTVTGAFAVTGLGVEPKAIIFMLTKQRTSDTEAIFAGAAMGIGWGFSVGSGANDNALVYGIHQGTNNSRQSRQDDACIQINATYNGAIQSRATMQSLDTDGFTLDFTTATSAAYVDWLAIGGTDITGAKVGRFDEPAASGNYSVTGVGFQPTAIIYADCWGGIGDIDQSQTNSSVRYQLSLLTAASQVAFCTAHTALNTASAQTTTLRGDSSLIYVQNTSTSPLARSTFVSMDADGFTQNMVTVPGGATTRTYLALAGTFAVQAGFATEPASAGNVDVAVPMIPQAALLCGQARAASTAVFGGTGSIEVDVGWGLWSNDGGHFSHNFTSLDQGSVQNSSKHNVSAMETLDQTGSSAHTVTSSFTLTGSTSGNAQFNYSSVIGNSAVTGYLFFGEAVAPPPSNTINRSFVSM